MVLENDDKYTVSVVYQELRYGQLKRRALARLMESYTKITALLIASTISAILICCQAPEIDPATMDGFITYGRNPVWSPNFDEIAFEYDKSIYEYNIKSNDTIRLISPGSHPSYSPDGNTIVYSLSGDLIVFSKLTGDTTFLCEGYRGVWSGDGTRIVYHGYSPPGNDSSIAYYDFRENTTKSYKYFSNKNFEYESLYDWGQGDSILHMLNAYNGLGILHLSDGQVDIKSIYTGYQSIFSFDWCESRGQYIYSFQEGELDGTHSVLGLFDTISPGSKIIPGPSGGSWSPSGDSIVYSENGGIFIQNTDSLYNF